MYLLVMSSTNHLGRCTLDWSGLSDAVSVAVIAAADFAAADYASDVQTEGCLLLSDAQ